MSGYCPSDVDDRESLSGGGVSFWSVCTDDIEAFDDA